MKIFLGLFSWLGSATPSGIGEENWAGTMNLSDKENLGAEKVADSSEEEYQAKNEKHCSRQKQVW